MSGTNMSPLTMHAAVERWPLAAPFRVTGYEWTFLDVIVVTLECRGRVGRGEAAGVYYRKETPDSMLAQLESVRGAVESGVDRNSVQRLLPAGGARNALDCALWDLEAKLIGTSVWKMAEVGDPKPLLTTFTCGADTPEAMAAAARAYKGARAIKLKLTGQGEDAERVRAVRRVKPDVWLGVDANQGFTPESLKKLLPVLVEERVKLIEQPFPIGQEHWLDGFESPIPFAADESVQGVADMKSLVGRFNVVNIKLDKCGGLTEALTMARTARALGLDTMVGNMVGTSLAMLPAAVVGQLCSVVDLDGPVFLKDDRPNPVRYVDGFIECPTDLWGSV